MRILRRGEAQSDHVLSPMSKEEGTNTVPSVEFKVVSWVTGIGLPSLANRCCIASDCFLLQTVIKREPDGRVEKVMPLPTSVSKRI